jgi:hypothetical protein
MARPGAARLGSFDKWACGLKKVLAFSMFLWKKDTVKRENVIHNAPAGDGLGQLSSTVERFTPLVVKHGGALFPRSSRPHALMPARNWDKIRRQQRARANKYSYDPISTFIPPSAWPRNWRSMSKNQQKRWLSKFRNNSAAQK